MLNSRLACTSLSDVGSLLLNNAEFRVFLGDLTTIGREVLRDVAFSLSAVSKEVGQEVSPPEGDGDAAKPLYSNADNPPSSCDLKEDAAGVTGAVAEGAGKVSRHASTSVSDISQEERETLLDRLKKTILGLRQRPDYTQSVSTLSPILRNCVKAYTQTLSETAESMEDDIQTNRETELALYNFWQFVISIGEPGRWKELEDAFKTMLENAHGDPQFERHVDQVADFLQAMLTDPEFYDSPEDRLTKLYNEFRPKSASSLHRDTDVFFSKLKLACSAALRDQDVRRLTESAKDVGDVLQKNAMSRTLLSDCMNVFAPRLVDAIQYIPIPRLEVASPTLDILLENLILEPGKTTNRSSFFPHRVGFSTRNDVVITKGRVNTTSRLCTFVRLSLSGMSVSAADVGCWLRYHSGPLRFASEGLVSVALDQRGVDVALDLEIGRDRIDELLSVRDVHVRVHRFNYEVRKADVSWITWLLKPLLRPIIRKLIEVRMKCAIKDVCTSVNRELLFARERLRATKVANPTDMWTFLRALTARLGSKQDADQYLRLGIDEPGMGVFEGVYAPGSLVKVWNEEQSRKGERARQSRRDGWRNSIFNI